MWQADSAVYQVLDITAKQINAAAVLLKTNLCQMTASQN
jgi:hypothetical protein